MTVKELIAKLQKIENQDRIVILQKDAEGNGYSPLYDADFENIVYEAHSTWSGEVGYETLTPDMEKDGYGEEDLIKGGVPAAVLYPIN